MIVFKHSCLKRQNIEGNRKFPSNLVTVREKTCLLLPVASLASEKNKLSLSKTQPQGRKCEASVEFSGVVLSTQKHICTDIKGTVSTVSNQL